MESGIELMIADLQSQLKAKAPALKYIDEDWGQLDYYSPNPPVKWPCGLVDVPDIVWNNDGNLQQEGLCTVKITLADLRLSNSSNAAPNNQKIKNSSFFGMVANVYKAVQGFSGNAMYSKLIRVRQQRVMRDDGVRLYELYFTCTIKDRSASPTKIKVQTSDLTFPIKGDFIIH